MKQSLPQPKFLTVLSGLVFGMLLSSCGSYQQASYYDNDGIYKNSDRRVSVERPRTTTPQNSGGEDGIYSDYFGERANEIDKIMENEVFTDIDGYYSGVEEDSLAIGEDNYYDIEQGYSGYGGFGENSSGVTINYYDNYGFNYPGIYSAWGLGGWYGFGLYSPWRYRWYNPWWNGGFYNVGFGFPYYGGFGFYGNYYGGFGFPYYGYGYGYGFYGYPYNRRGFGYFNNNYGYNRSRRGYYNNAIASNSFRGRSNLNSGNRGTSTRLRNSGNSSLNRSGISNRTSNRYRSNSVTGRSVNADAIARNRAYRSSRSTRAVPRYNSNSRTNQIYRNSSPRTSTYNRGTVRRPQSSAARPSTQRRSVYSRSATTPRQSGYRGNSRSSTPRSSGYKSGRSSTPRSSGYRSSRSSSTRSSGVRSSGSRSSGRSSGAIRSSSPSRSSGVSRSSGRSSGRRN